MNDDNKIINQDANPVAQTDQTQPQAPQTQVQPVAPVGSVSKETGPVSPNLSEFVRPSGPEASPNLSQEEKKLGVEVKSDKPNLTFEHKELGVDHAGPHVPVPSSPSGKVTMPMSEEEIKDKLKTGQNDDSGKWLAGLIQKVIRAMGFSN